MYLIGASGHAKVIMDILKSQGIEVDALYDGNENITELLGKPVLHHHNFATPIIISIGNNNIRKRIAEELNLEWGTAIHFNDGSWRSVTMRLFPFWSCDCERSESFQK